MTPTHAQRIVSTHYHLEWISEAEARAEVLNCARKRAKGSECDLAESLRLSFELAYGVPIDEIAFHAEANWPRT